MRTLMRDERGLSLPETIVASVVNLLVLGVIATGVVTFAAVHHSIGSTATTVSNAAVIDAELRLAASGATSTGAGADTVVFQRQLGTDCVETRYDLSGDTLTMSKGDCGATEVRHSLELGSDHTNTLSFTNVAGRTMTFPGGTPTLAAEPDPGHPEWDSTVLGAVALDVVFAGTERQVILNTTAVTSAVSRSAGSVPAEIDTEFVEAPIVP